jgi:hypothetical protein
MDPKQLALQLKPQLEAKGYTVDAQGNVRYPPSGNGIHPPWAWAQAFPELPASYKTPGSDPSSAWHGMYQEGGPFVTRSQWDQGQGTYESSIDWGTLLGSIAAGSLIGGGVASAFGGAGGAPAASGSAASASPAASGAVPAATAATTGASTVIPATAASQSAAEAALGSAGGGVLSGTSGNVIKALTALASVYGGHKLGEAAQGQIPPQLNDLLDMAVQRQKQQVPLTQAVDQGTFQMLPTYARQGITPPSFAGAQKLFGGG